MVSYILGFTAGNFLCLVFCRNNDVNAETPLPIEPLISTRAGG